MPKLLPCWGRPRQFCAGDLGGVLHSEGNLHAAAEVTGTGVGLDLTMRSHRSARLRLERDE